MLFYNQEIHNVMLNRKKDAFVLSGAQKCSYWEDRKKRLKWKLILIIVIYISYNFKWRCTEGLDGKSDFFLIKCWYSYLTLNSMCSCYMCFANISLQKGYYILKLILKSYVLCKTFLIHQNKYDQSMIFFCSIVSKVILGKLLKYCF